MEPGRCEVKNLLNFLAWVVCGAMAFGGCSTALDKARIATTAAADLGLSSARFVADYNDACEGAALKLAQANKPAEAKSAAEKCRATYEKLDQAVKTYGAAVASTRAGVELAATMKKLDIGLVLRELLSAGRALKAALEAFGIAIPGLGGLL
jgi:Flp pilus assembly protein TadG